MKTLLRYAFLSLFLAAQPCAAAAPALLQPDVSAPIIAQLVARILEEGQYERKPITLKTSPEMLRLYLRMYDPSRMFFTAADIAEFNARFQPDMAPRVKEGHVEPGYFVFNRFMKRLAERVDWVHEFARSTYTFTSDAVMLIDRSKAPWPADRAAARALWRKEVELELLQDKLNGMKPADADSEVVKNYDRLLGNYGELEPGDVLQSYLTALANCYDPHSEYMAATTEENFDITMSLSLVGIGVVLQQDEGSAKIVSIVPGGPAAKSGQIHPNDRIEAVAQGEDGAFAQAAGMKLDNLVKLIRGKKGTVVRLKIAPADALDPSTRITVPLVREKILLRDQQASAKIALVPEEKGGPLRVGVIKLPSFYTRMGPSGGESAGRDVKTLLDYLKGQDVAGVILDLRDNGGGSLDEAVNIAGLFIGGGPVVQVRDGSGDVSVLRSDEKTPDYSGPLVVLDSRFSASASEIVSAALKDYGRAVLVGERSTFGKGTVQAVVDLDQYMPYALRGYKAGGLKLTFQKFYRVSGGSTQNRGVRPDIRLPSLEDYVGQTESSLPNALPYDQIAPARYIPDGDVTPAETARLAADSAARVEASPDFRYVRQDIELYLSRKRAKTISLNYARRLAERKADEARRKERAAERAARKVRPLAMAGMTLEDIAAGRQPVFVSTAAAGDFAGGISTGSAQAGSSASVAGVGVSTSDAAGYAKAPPESDFMLEEAARVLADIVEPQAPAADGRTASVKRRPAARK